MTWDSDYNFMDDYNYDYDGCDEESFAHEPGYTIIYEGHLFEGDKPEGLNFHDMDNWDEVHSLMVCYHDVITVKDNCYGVMWKDGEWY